MGMPKWVGWGGAALVTLSLHLNLSREGGISENFKTIT